MVERNQLQPGILWADFYDSLWVVGSDLVIALSPANERRDTYTVGKNSEKIENTLNYH